MGFTFSQLIYGPISDSLGRRIIVLTGLMIAALGSMLCVFAPNIELLTLGRLIQGVGIGACAALSRTIVRDIFTGTRLAQIGSYMGTIMAVVPAIAPIAGGYLQMHIGWRANFWTLLALNIILLAAMYFFLPETNKHRHENTSNLIHILKNYAALLKHKQFIAFSLCSCYAGAGLIAYLTVSPFLMQDILHLTAVEYGWLSVFITSALVIGSILNALLVNKLGLNKMILGGFLLMSLGGLTMLGVGLAGQLSVLAVMLPMTIFIAGSKLIYANAFSGALEPFGKIAGTAGALYGCLQILGSTVVSALMSITKAENQLPLAIALTSLGLLGILTFYFLIYSKKSLTNQQAI